MLVNPITPTGAPGSLTPLEEQLEALFMQLRKDEWGIPNPMAVDQDLSAIQSFLVNHEQALVAACQEAGWSPGSPPPGPFRPNPFTLLFGQSEGDLKQGTIWQLITEYQESPSVYTAMQLNEDLTSLFTDLQFGPKK